MQRKQIEDAYNQGYRDGEETDGHYKKLEDVSEWADAQDYYYQKFKVAENK